MGIELISVTEFFDAAYRKVNRYWWQGDWRYSTNPDDHPRSVVTQLLLRHLRSRSLGRALDLGCGEGADAIRLAKLGWTVDALELSRVGVEKSQRLAREEGVSINVYYSNALDFETDFQYDVIICNGVMHYILDKAALLRKIDAFTAPGGCNVISLWSDYTPVAEPHKVVPTYPDQEEGVVTSYYRYWEKLLIYFEREKLEASHSDFGPHMHSFIKLIALKPR